MERAGAHTVHRLWGEPLMATATARQPLLTPAEAAAYLRRAAKTLRNWRSEGTGPTYTGHGHGVRYRQSDLDAWLKANTH